MIKSIDGLANRLALTAGNAYIVPSDDDNADEPWKMATIFIDGEKHIFISKDTKKPKHVEHIIPATSFNDDGLRHIFRHCPPPIEFCRMLAHNRPFSYLSRFEFHFHTTENADDI